MWLISFSEVDFVAPENDALFSVGVNRYEGEPQPLQPDAKLFTFLTKKPTSDMSYLIAPLVLSVGTRTPLNRALAKIPAEAPLLQAMGMKAGWPARAMSVPCDLPFPSYQTE